MHLNASRDHADQWQPQPPSASRTDEPKIQRLLFNVLTVVLAAATLIAACIHVVHERRASRRREATHVQNRNSEAPASANGSVERDRLAQEDHTSGPVHGREHVVNLNGVELGRNDPDRARIIVNVMTEDCVADAERTDVETSNLEVNSNRPEYNENVPVHMVSCRVDGAGPNLRQTEAATQTA